MNENLEDLQNHLLEIAKTIDAICVKNNILYSISGGTALGAYLHKGFIPWDDDMDIFMTRENFNRFIEACKTDLPEYYKLSTFDNDKKNKRNLLTKIIDERTTVIELCEDGEEITTGAFVDVSILDKLPLEKRIRNIIITICRLRTVVVSVSYSKNIVKKIIHICLKPFRNILYKIICYTLTKQCAREDNYEYAELIVGLPMTYDKEMFCSYERIQFENIELMVVSDYLAYLKKRYDRNEFYTPSSREEMTQHFIYFDCNKSYKDVIKEKR